MRVLVCGGREFDDWDMLHRTLTDIYIQRHMTSMVIVQGGAKGADFLGKVWAKNKNLWCSGDSVITSEEYPADWKQHGYRAGHIRNQQMLDEGDVDLVVAFPGGKGTANMISLSKKAGVEVMEV
jgi:hypothetical protein